MNKFGRNYEIVVQATGGGPDVIIKPPFTIDFDVQRHRYSSATLSTIRIFNLSKTNRSKLRKDQTDPGLQKKCIFRAGYGNDLSTPLVGNVIQGFSVREGNNYITTLQIFDGGYAYANSSLSVQYSENTPYKNVVTDLIKSLKEFGIGQGSIGNINGNTGRGISLTGSTISNLKELTDGRFFIDNNTAHCLGEYETNGVKFVECVPAPLKKIDSSSGLIGTPQREWRFLNLDIVFEPKVIAGQRIELDSITGDNVNGLYQVISIRHRGTISESESGDCVTSLTLEGGLGNLIDVVRNS